jgi:hypothetical protein
MHYILACNFSGTVSIKNNFETFSKQACKNWSALFLKISPKINVIQKLPSSINSFHRMIIGKGKAIPLQAWTGP